MKPLSPVRVNDRELRTIVGLRPFRASGFRVGSERRGDKLLVHNYGHGGAGVTLSWGTSELATRLALAAPAREIAVLGCGAVGLASARLLQRAGARVTIYAAELPPDTTSNIAGALWLPVTVCASDAFVGTFREQLLAAANFSQQQFQSLIDKGYGVRWLPTYLLADAPFSDDDELVRLQRQLGPLLRDATELTRDESPFAVAHARRFETLMIETPIYLNALLRDVRAAGGVIVQRRFAHADELATLPEPTIVNCSGLGARTLFDDDELMPIQGQLTVRPPQPEVDYGLIYGELYMFPRSDGILLGGTHDEGDFSLAPDLVAKRRLLDGHARLFAPLVKS